MAFVINFFLVVLIILGFCLFDLIFFPNTFNYDPSDGYDPSQD